MYYTVAQSMVKLPLTIGSEVWYTLVVSLKKNLISFQLTECAKHLVKLYGNIETYFKC